jgi:hypothetical protein
MAELVTRLIGLGDAERRKWAERRHKDYDTWWASWGVLQDAYDGAGGFLNGDYLWRFPREDGDKFKERKTQARYHNYTEALVDLLTRYVFAKPPVRTSTSEPLMAWWNDVDRGGADMTTWMQRSLSQALAVGHSGVLMDKPAVVPTGPSRADERGLEPFLRRYAPLHIPDWRVSGTRLIAVKLLDEAPIEDVLEGASDKPDALVWDETEWLRLREDGSIRAQGTHDLGAVPFDVLRPQSAERFPLIGKPLINANVPRALYNRASEEDDVLRNQAFSLFVVKLPVDADVEKAKTQMGGDVGTTSALFVQGDADYSTPSQEVPATLREAQQYLVREMYRMCHVRYDSDSREAESAESIRLKNADLNQMLAGLASECTRHETVLAQHWFRWMAPANADAAYQQAEVVIAYPREFFTAGLLVELEELARAMALGLGPTFEARLRNRVVDRMDPDLDEQTRETVRGEIEQATAQKQQQAQAGAVLEADALRQNAATRLARFAEGA